MFSSTKASAMLVSLRGLPCPVDDGRVMRASVRRRLGSTTMASLRCRSERLTMNADQLNGTPTKMGCEEGGPVKVHVTPKSGMDGLR